MTPADAGLVQRTLEGDLEGFGELHRRYFEPLTRAVTRILRDRNRAEDVAQEAYRLAFESLPRLGEPERFFPWIRRIAVNRAVEEVRRSGRRERLRERWAPRHEPTTEPTSALDRLVDGEEAERVRELLEKLPERQRAAVVLRFFEGLSFAEAAEVLGCREVTVRSNVFRGLRRLGASLSEEER